MVVRPSDATRRCPVRWVKHTRGNAMRARFSSGRAARCRVDGRLRAVRRGVSYRVRTDTKFWYVSGSFSYMDL